MRLDISNITLNHELQPRATIDPAVVTEYAEAMKEGAKFPGVTVFYDGAIYILADGFHRVAAAREAGQVSIEADVKNGDLDAARWFSYSVNQSHGLRRSNADKRRAVEHALSHPNAATMTDSAIARHVGVSSMTVGNHRAAIIKSFNDSLHNSPPPAREVTRNGTTYTMQVKESPFVLRQESQQERRRDDEWRRTEQARAALLEPSFPVAVPNEGVYTQVQWAKMSDAQQATTMAAGITAKTTSRFNDQKTDNIEWARWSWNPVTGCKHNCIYCYARDIANRFYQHKFEPAIIPERLAIPRMMNPPPEAAHSIGYKNVFTCSMADLFGRWVPQDWIDAVFNVVIDSPKWNFLFLTKFPLRMAEQNWPKNAWVGTSVDSQARVEAAERAFSKVKAGIKWLSCEPLLEPLKFKSLEMFDWIVIGGQTASTQAPEFQPRWEWIEDLLNQARRAKCKVYFKTNLHRRPLEYPGSVSHV